MSRDTTYFMVDSNALRFDKIVWYKNEYDGFFSVYGNSGDFWFRVIVDYPEKFFDLNRWKNDRMYQYKAYSMPTPKNDSEFIKSLKLYV